MLPLRVVATLVAIISTPAMNGAHGELARVSTTWMADKVGFVRPSMSGGETGLSSDPRLSQSVHDAV